MPRRWFARYVFVFAVSLAAVCPRASAMSVQPPSFAELVAESATVARARVTDLTSRAVINANGQREIRTFVTFTTLKALKGNVPPAFTLSFLGGTADGERWQVPGMPEFRVGDEEFVFDSGRPSICPLVGAMHGRYRVQTDPADGHAYVARNDRTPLTSVSQVGSPMAETPQSIRPASALRPEEFEAKIAEEVAHPTHSSARP